MCQGSCLRFEGQSIELLKQTNCVEVIFVCVEVIEADQLCMNYIILYI